MWLEKILYDEAITRLSKYDRPKILAEARNASQNIENLPSTKWKKWIAKFILCVLNYEKRELEEAERKDIESKLEQQRKVMICDLIINLKTKKLLEEPTKTKQTKKEEIKDKEQDTSDDISNISITQIEEKIKKNKAVLSKNKAIRNDINDALQMYPNNNEMRVIINDLINANKSQVPGSVKFFRKDLQLHITEQITWKSA